ncbi:MAG: CrcB family protein [Solirubrobacterales bacterium]
MGDEGKSSALWREPLAVFTGGVAGTLLRAGLLEAFPVHPGAWPWPTFIANVAGCAMLSFVITHLRVNGGPSVRLALLGTGFCGALTTFSTLQVELYDLLDAGESGTAVVYLGTSIALGLLAVAFTRRAVERGRELA